MGTVYKIKLKEIEMQIACPNYNIRPLISSSDIKTSILIFRDLEISIFIFISDVFSKKIIMFKTKVKISNPKVGKSHAMKK